jgi:5'-nucleotidase
MASIKAVGFDMDHTLAPYNHVNFETLAFKVTLDKFIAAGYPIELSEVRFDPTSVIRGLLVDQTRGNLLKVDGHKYVKTAYHGKVMLDKEERYRLYNAQSFRADQFISVDTFFALSEVQLFIEIVEFMRKNPGKIKKSYEDIYKDLRTFIDLSHADGSIKTEVIRDPKTYINKDKHLDVTLERLKDTGKTIFLLTNSDWSYSNSVMTYLLGEHWRQYFDICIVSAKKPAFFSQKNPFFKFNPETGKVVQHRGQLRASDVYTGGHARKLQQLMGMKGDEILYVGDHIYGDIITSKGIVNWRTMLVVEEMEREIQKLDETRPILDEIIQMRKQREALDEELQRFRSKLNMILKQTNNKNNLDRDRSKMEQQIGEIQIRIGALDLAIRDKLNERSQKIHPVWGEVMKVGLERSRFANQVERYACLYTGKVSNLRLYSPAKLFVSPHELLPHDLD